MNTILLIVIIFSVIGFFFTVFIPYMMSNYAVNDIYYLEGTDLSIRYSNRTGSGLYQGPERTGVLKVEGNFGHDWGAVITDDLLYTNEFLTSDTGVMICRLVKIDLNTFEKETLLDNTALRGQCASGELVCTASFLPKSDYPRSSSICRLYAMVSDDIFPDSDLSHILIIDPVSSQTVFTITDDISDEDHFEEHYIDRTLKEISQ